MGISNFKPTGFSSFWRQRAFPMVRYMVRWAPPRSQRAPDRGPQREHSVHSWHHLPRSSFCAAGSHHPSRHQSGLCHCDSHLAHKRDATRWIHWPLQLASFPRGSQTGRQRILKVLREAPKPLWPLSCETSFFESAKDTCLPISLQRRWCGTRY